MTKMTENSTLRSRYMEHLVSPIVIPGKDGPRRGTVAGKETRRGMRTAALWAQETQGSWQDLLDTYENDPARVWIWSDHHLGHDNIIRYTNRPFGNAKMMDQGMLENAQACVAADDWLIFVGDLAMWKEPELVHAWVKACPGKKAIVIGNHDLKGRGHPQSSQEWIDLGFDAVADCLELPALHGARRLWMTHYPFDQALLPEGVLNVHGHTHTQLFEGPFVNVCVEHLAYAPRRLLDVVKGA